MFADFHWKGGNHDIDNREKSALAGLEPGLAPWSTERVPLGVDLARYDGHGLDLAL